MGTNFYIRGRRQEWPGANAHIGKRSAASLFCWDCGVTLCADGPDAIHDGKSKMLDACPKCGKKKPDSEDLTQSSAGRELGFNTSAPGRKTGVRSCSSFRWGIDPKTILESLITIGDDGACPCCSQVLPNPEKVIEDEHGRPYTLDEFKAVLEECPIQYTDMIGREFS